MKFISNAVLFFCLIPALLSCSREEKSSSKIDRNKLVSRHNIILTHPDTLGALSVGNGEFAFTVDVTGLQTYPEDYENGIPLGTQSQWGWHSIPTEKKYSVNDVAVPFESCDGTKAPYAVQHATGPEKQATESLRVNPHRLHLGLVGLILLTEDGNEVALDELLNVHQTLDLWTGKIESTYDVDGIPVRVVLYGHQENDAISVRIESPLIGKDRLKIRFRFPYGKDCHVCPGYDWDNPGKHKSSIVLSNPNDAAIKHELDSTVYFVHTQWSDGTFAAVQPHTFVLNPSIEKNEFEFSVSFSPDASTKSAAFDATQENSISQWRTFWNSGAAIDFSECTDPRARELERRVILSQYLTKIQCAGSMPPQETGLTMNSWYGKFHLEMHWWHAAHFAFWNRPDLMKEGLDWYTDVTAKAKSTAQWQGYKGARWQKMTDPYGDESPSNIGAFIIWQQPHPIYLAELMYRNDSSARTLQQYKDLVFNTADFMASFVKRREGKFSLCHPLVPAQEIFKATETDDPAYELQYWYYGLTVAQKWRERLKLPAEPHWDEIIRDLAPLVVKDDLYLPNSTTPEAYTDDQYRRDHPAVVGAFGFLPFNNRIDTVIMKNTFDNIMNKWEWETTWGWDYPLLAMTAARLNKPEQAVDALLLDVQKNTYLINGHNYQDPRLRLYLPGNGGVLAAVAMMAAGWDGNTVNNPGFPKDGKWNVRWEGFVPMP